MNYLSINIWYDAATWLSTDELIPSVKPVIGYCSRLIIAFSPSVIGIHFNPDLKSWKPFILSTNFIFRKTIIIKCKYDIKTL